MTALDIAFTVFIVGFYSFLLYWMLSALELEGLSCE